MARIWLPPIETCCDECKTITITVHRNATLHFGLECSAHGDKGITSPLGKSTKMNYKIIIPPDIKEQEQLFHKDLSIEAQERKRKYCEEWNDRNEALG